MTAYYNEIDTDKAAWLRELIKAGVIAPGDVDERSIKMLEQATLWDIPSVIGSPALESGATLSD